MDQRTRHRRNADDTRARILDAAIFLFSSAGFSATGVRDICRRADANPALVNRYFGSKLGLFRAALDEALDSKLITTLGRDGFGDRLVALFTDSRNGARNPLPMMMFAAADPEAQAVAQAEIEERVVLPLAQFFGGGDGTARAARLMAVACGFFTYRILYPLEPFQGDLAEDDRRWLARAFDSCLA